MEYNTILIVDDSKTSRLIVRRCLEMAGVEASHVLEADDGTMALDVLHEQTVDLIITDLKMPRMDGRTLVRQLRSRAETADIPIVVVSSLAEGIDEDPIIGENVLAAIQKPVSPTKFMEALGA